MDIMNFFPSKYLNAGDLEDRPHLWTIKGLKTETIGEETFPVLYFNEEQKALRLNKTNSKAIAAIYGRDPTEWPGKKIVCFPMMVQFKDDIVPAIRVRAPKPQAQRPGGSTLTPMQQQAAAAAQQQVTTAPQQQHDESLPSGFYDDLPF